MAQEELVKMSEKGQLVVPRRIREKEGFKGSDRFVAIEVKDGVLFKRVEIPKVKIEFESLQGTYNPTSRSGRLSTLISTML